VTPCSLLEIYRRFGGTYLYFYRLDQNNIIKQVAAITWLNHRLWSLRSTFLRNVCKLYWTATRYIPVDKSPGVCYVVQFCGLPRLILEKQRIISNKTKAYKSFVSQMVHSDLHYGSIFPVTVISLNHTITIQTARIIQQGVTRTHRTQLARARCSVVGWGTMLQAGMSWARSPMRSLDFQLV
jgi:hypothetical protein